MDTTHSKTKRPQEQAIESIDWDDVEDAIGIGCFSPPEGAITSKMIQDKYGISHRTAQKRLAAVLASDKYEASYYIGRTGGRIRYAKKK
jgi:predicted HTH transcriptional regulator